MNQSGEVHVALVLKKNAKIAKIEMEAAKMLNKDYRMIAVNENYIAIFLIYLLAVIVIKHRENIKRLLNRTENKIKLSK